MCWMAIEIVFSCFGSFVVCLLFIQGRNSDEIKRKFDYSPNLRGKEIQVLSVRFKKLIGIEASLLYKVSLSNDDIDSEKLTWIGYERNAKGKILPQTTDMTAFMDPEK